MAIKVKFSVRLVTVVSTTLLLLISLLVPINPAVAANSSDFNPGNIISDSLFFDGNSLSSNQIQSFLNEKVPICTINNGQPGRAAGAPAGNTTIAQTCLKNFSQTTTNMSGKNSSNQQVCNDYIGSSSETAATIIAKVGAACGISQKVLLVLIQKEQSLITDSWPTVQQYNSATGFACFDNNQPCVSTFGGFFNQVWAAAKQLKNYGVSPTFNWFPVGQTVNIRYQAANTEASLGISCGTKPVYIQNKATAALYYYTPYTPNQAALQNLYGTGDSCSAYGNRNFWRLFVDWFGLSESPPTYNSGVIARDNSGKLWLYPSSPKRGWFTPIIIGVGWQSMTGLSVSGDLTGDGNRDLTAIDSSGTLWVYPTNGALGWKDRFSITTGISPSSKILPVGDFDGFKGQDLLLLDAAGDLWLFSGNGRGSFEAASKVGSGWSGFANVTAAGDLDSDGLGDLIAQTQTGSLIFYASNGAGKWKSPRVVGSGWNSISTTTGVGDWDGDSLSDYLGRNNSGTLFLYSGNGLGSFKNTRAIGSGWNEMNLILGAPAESRGPFFFDAGTGDLDRDGAPDLITETENGKLGVFSSNRVGGWRGVSINSIIFSFPSAPTPIGDFDSDGKNDFFLIDQQTKELLKFSVNADKSTTNPISIGSGWAGFDRLITGGDQNGDNKVDLLATDTLGNLWLYPGDGLGGWLPRSLVGSGWPATSRILYPGDFDGNGFTDLIRIDQSGLVWLYSGLSGTGWAAPTVIGTGWQNFTEVISSGDFSGDNIPDLIARSQDGGLWLYPGNGSGSWKPAKQIGVGWGSMKWIR